MFSWREARVQRGSCVACETDTGGGEQEKAHAFPPELPLVKGFFLTGYVLLERHFDLTSLCLRLKVYMPCAVFLDPRLNYLIFLHGSFDLRLRAQCPEAITHASSYKEGVAKPRIHEKAANRRFTPPYSAAFPGSRSGLGNGR